jgi:hypothetical protein
MQTYRTWEDLEKLNGVIRTTSHINPYKETTEEFQMVEYVISLNGKQVLNKNQHENSINIVKLFQKNKINANLDPWYVYSLYPKALWLARAAGCIQIEKISKYVNHSINDHLQFGCYFEAGMKNYFTLDKCKNELSKMKKEKSTYKT